MKLINLGLPKSGTSTLHRALAHAGIRSAHWYIGKKGTLVARRIYRAYFNGCDPLRDFKAYDAITQCDFVGQSASYWPQMDLGVLRSIRSYHPECKFLLLTRNPRKILSSVDTWFDLRERLERLGAPGLPPGVAHRDGAMIRWIETHYANMIAVFGDDPQFHVVDIEARDARARISEVVGTDLNWWGKANASADLPARQLRVA